MTIVEGDGVREWWAERRFARRHARGPAQRRRGVRHRRGRRARGLARRLRGADAGLPLGGSGHRARAGAPGARDRSRGPAARGALARRRAQPSPADDRPGGRATRARSARTRRSASAPSASCGATSSAATASGATGCSWTCSPKSSRDASGADAGAAQPCDARAPDAARTLGPVTRAGGGAAARGMQAQEPGTRSPACGRGSRASRRRRCWARCTPCGRARDAHALDAAPLQRGDYAALRMAMQPPMSVAPRVLGARSKGLDLDAVLPAARKLLRGRRSRSTRSGRGCRSGFRTSTTARSATRCGRSCRSSWCPSEDARWGYRARVRLRAGG